MEIHCLTQPALQSAERRRNMFSTQCSAALNQLQTVAIGQTRENSRIEFPIVERCNREHSRHARR